MSLPIAKKVVVVTGAGRGIGRAISEKMAHLGGIVVATDYAMENLNETLPALKGISSQPHEGFLMDVTSKESVQKACRYVGEKYGRIDILVNNAGVSSMQRIEDLTEEEWDFNFNVNMKGLFFVTQAALPYMKKVCGRIVNIASMASLKGAPLLAHYAASKWAVMGFTKSCALEFGEYKMTVNCICPGYVKTTMQDNEVEWEGKLRGMTPQEVRDEYIDLTPLGAICTAEQVADAAGFLAGPDSAFITGAHIAVTGGADLH